MRRHALRLAALTLSVPLLTGVAGVSAAHAEDTSTTNDTSYYCDPETGYDTNGDPCAEVTYAKW